MSVRNYVVECPEDICRELARISYELTMENTVIDRFLDRHLSDPEALESPTFMKFASSVTEKTAEYEMLKAHVTNDILSGLNGHDADWSLDFNTGKISITVRCDCDLGWLEPYRV